MRALAALLIVGSAFAFALGLVLPLMTLDRLLVFTEEPSLIGVIAGLWSDGQVALSLVVLVFSVLFPAAKLVWLQLALAGVGHGAIRHLHALGRWSMMDVLVVALVVFAAKTSGLAAAIAEPGLWFFAVATLGTAVAAGLVERSAISRDREAVPGG